VAKGDVVNNVSYQVFAGAGFTFEQNRGQARIRNRGDEVGDRSHGRARTDDLAAVAFLPPEPRESFGFLGMSLRFQSLADVLLQGFLREWLDQEAPRPFLQGFRPETRIYLAGGGDGRRLYQVSCYVL